MKDVCIAVVGSINMDLVVNSARMPAPGETIIGHAFNTVPGGKGANQAVAAARLGARVEMIGCLGGDAFGKTLRSRLEDEGISTQYVRTEEEAESGVALIQVDATGENAITVVQGSNGRVEISAIEGVENAIVKADVVLMQLEIPLYTVDKVLEISRDAKVLTILDPAPVPPGEFPEKLYNVDVLSPNQHEAEALTNVPVLDASSAEKAAQLLQDRGAGAVVIKMGGAGAFVLSAGGETKLVPPFPTKVIDTTAAGDAFTAALGVGLAMQMDSIAATRLGCAAGSLAIRKPGAQDAMPNWDEVKRLFEEA